MTFYPNPLNYESIYCKKVVLDKSMYDIWSRRVRKGRILGHIERQANDA